MPKPRIQRWFAIHCSFMPEYLIPSFATAFEGVFLRGQGNRLQHVTSDMRLLDMPGPLELGWPRFCMCTVCFGLNCGTDKISKQLPRLQSITCPTVYQVYAFPCCTAVLRSITVQKRSTRVLLSAKSCAVLYAIDDIVRLGTRAEYHVLTIALRC